jgi:hypothetical protein
LKLGSNGGERVWAAALTWGGRSLFIVLGEGLAVAALFGPKSPGSRDQSLRAKWPVGGVSGQGDWSLRPGKPPAIVSGVSLRPPYWDERHPLKRRPGDLGQSLWSQIQSLRCVHTGVSGLETQSLRLRQDNNLASFRSSPITETRLRQNG